MAPNITEYTAPLDSLQPSEAAPDAARQAGAAQKSAADAIGAGISKVFSGAGTILDRYQTNQANQDISAGTADYATAVFKQGQDWNNTYANTDPNSVGAAASKAITDNSAFWDDWASKFTNPTSSRWAQDKAASAKLDFQKSVAADSANAAADAAQANQQSLIRATAAHAALNPDQIDSILASLPKDVANTIPPGADPTVRNKAITEGVAAAQTAAVQSFLTSLAINQPDQFAKEQAAGQLDQYAGYLPPTAGLDKYQRLAQATQRSLQTQKDVQATAQAKAQVDAINNAAAPLVAGVHNPDGTISQTGLLAFYKAIGPGGSLVQLPGVTSANVTDWTNFADNAKNGTKSQDDPATVKDFTDRETGPGNYTKVDVQNALIQGKLTKQTADSFTAIYDALHSSAQDPGLTAAIDRATTTAFDLMTPNATTLAAASGQPDQVDAALQREATYKQLFNAALLAGVANGKSVQSMVDPNSKDYIVPGVLAQAMTAVTIPSSGGNFFSAPTPPPDFTPGATAVLGPNGAPAPASATPAAPASPNARLPGESAADYLKRMGAAGPVTAAPTPSSVAAPTATAPVAPVAVAKAAVKGIDYSAFGANADKVQAGVEAWVASGFSPGWTHNEEVRRALRDPTLQAAIASRIPEAQGAFDKMNGQAPGGATLQKTSYEPAASGPNPAASLPANVDYQTAGMTLLAHWEGMDAVGRWDNTQWTGGHGSSTTTLADGTVVPVTKGMVVTPEDADRDLQRQLPLLAQQVQSQIGTDEWTALPPLAQVVMVSLLYNYGHVPGSVVNALSSGNLMTIAQAVQDLGKRPGVQNPDRRREEANVIRSVANPTFQDRVEQVRANPDNGVYLPPNPAAGVVPSTIGVRG